MDQSLWYAIRVRGQQETIASQSLTARGLETFLPSYESRRRWTDRVKVMQVPVFPGYVFSRFQLSQKALILGAAGCVQIVGFGGQITSVPGDDIEALKRMVNSGFGRPHSYVSEGMRVRICTGAFEDLEGYIKNVKNRDRLIVSLHLLQRSVSVELEAGAVHVLCPVRRPTPRATLQPEMRRAAS